MKRTDFYYELPEELIAQTPLYPRDSSKLLHLSKENGVCSDGKFTDIIELLNEGDLLVLNNSRVLPARLYGNKEMSGGKVEFLLLAQREKDVWEIMVRPGRKAQPGTSFVFGNGILKGEILSVLDGGNRLAKFSYDGDFYSVLDQIGEMPLPHYITKKLDDKERYQTVYSKERGSAAAPTAGLHFTPEVMNALAEKGVSIAYVTLHVGLGTFRPVKADDIIEHKMHSESYFCPKETADIINRTKSEGGRVIAVGTTSCRTIESIATMYNGEIKECSGDTDIFIYPGYEFKILDGLITNFHLPESTLIMLVSAFAGYEETMSAYRHAVENKYRFFSFGDSMAIL